MDPTTTPTSGPAPLTVTFTNLSTSSGEIVSYEWAFGDGATSVLTDPLHVYTQTGSFTVILTATAGTESDTETKVDYITVNAPSQPALVTRTATATYTYDGLYRLTGAEGVSPTVIWWWPGRR